MFLEQYIERSNAMRKAFGLDLMDVPTNFEQSKPIFKKLAADLSPENLSRDGEASHEEVRSKRTLLNGAWAELEAICGKEVSEFDI